MSMATEAGKYIDGRAGTVEEGEEGVEQMGQRRQVVLAVEGMMCATCAMRIEKGLKKLPGVAEASVNLASEQAAVTYDSTQTDLEQMTRKVAAIGYKAVPLMATSSSRVQTPQKRDTTPSAVDTIAAGNSSDGVEKPQRGITSYSIDTIAAGNIGDKAEKPQSDTTPSTEDTSHVHGLMQRIAQEDERGQRR